jgi:hypothetical protein
LITVHGVRDPDTVPAGLWLIGVCSAVVLLVVLVAMVRLSIAALGLPRDRAAADETLRRAAGRLGGRFRGRREYPWYRRPSQYGAVEGRLGDVTYELTILPWNAEDHGGSAMLRIHPRPGERLAGDRPGFTIFTPARVWHWPDLADPDLLADYVRQAIVAVDSGEAPPAAW